MPGLQNKRNSGRYQGPHTVLTPKPKTAQAIGMQVTQTGETTVFFEQSPLDTLGTPFAHTQSHPAGQAVHGVTCGKGNGVCGFSRILTVQGQPAQQSLTQNFLYGGNCALAHMAEKSQARSVFFVGS